MASFSSSYQTVLTLTLSQTSKDKVEAILADVSKLSPLEKLYLYLRLPARSTTTSNGDCKPPSMKAEVSAAHRWINTHLQENPKVCLTKHTVYADYSRFCERQSAKCLSREDFGKIVLGSFPSVVSRRLGTQKQAKHCYGGLAERTNFTQSKPAEIQPQISKFQLDGKDSTKELCKASCIVICDWAQKVLNTPFPNLFALARYVVNDGCVNLETAAAYTVQCLAPKSNVTTGADSSNNGVSIGPKGHLKQRLSEKQRINEQKQLVQQRLQTEQSQTETHPDTHIRTRPVPTVTPTIASKPNTTNPPHPVSKPNTMNHPGLMPSPIVVLTPTPNQGTSVQAMLTLPSAQGGPPQHIFVPLDLGAAFSQVNVSQPLAATLNHVGTIQSVVTAGPPSLTAAGQQVNAVGQSVVSTTQLVHRAQCSTLVDTDRNDCKGLTLAGLLMSKQPTVWAHPKPEGNTGSVLAELLKSPQSPDAGELIDAPRSLLAQARRPATKTVSDLLKEQKHHRIELPRKTNFNDSRPVREIIEERRRHRSQQQNEQPAVKESLALSRKRSRAAKITTQSAPTTPVSAVLEHFDKQNGSTAQFFPTTQLMNGSLMYSHETNNNIAQPMAVSAENKPYTLLRQELQECKQQPWAWQTTGFTPIQTANDCTPRSKPLYSDLYPRDCPPPNPTYHMNQSDALWQCKQETLALFADGSYDTDPCDSGGSSSSTASPVTTKVSFVLPNDNLRPSFKRNLDAEHNAWLAKRQRHWSDQSGLRRHAAPPSYQSTLQSLLLSGSPGSQGSVFSNRSMLFLPPESPFSSEIQDIMSGRRADLQFSPVMEECDYRSQSVPPSELKLPTLKNGAICPSPAARDTAATYPSFQVQENVEDQAADFQKVLDELQHQQRTVEEKVNTPFFQENNGIWSHQQTSASDKMNCQFYTTDTTWNNEEGLTSNDNGLYDRNEMTLTEDLFSFDINGESDIYRMGL